MKHLLAAAALTLGGLAPSLLAGAPPRFSSGPIHSGKIEIVLDIAGAKNLSLTHTGKESEIEWRAIRFTDADGKQTDAKKLRVKPAHAAVAARHYALDDEKLVQLSLELSVSSEKGGGLQVLIDHDAPRTAAKPSTESIIAMTGDATRGRSVFFGRGTCASCHAVAGRGAKVGPDLTKLGKRASTKEIVESITDPDSALAPGFETNIIETRDGTPNLGFVVSDRRESITIRDSAAQSHVIRKSHVVVRKPQSFSLMPPFGEILSPQQIADLVAFLRVERGG